MPTPSRGRGGKPVTRVLITAHEHPAAATDVPGRVMFAWKGDP